MVEQSWASESGIQFKESGIPLTIRIQNPSPLQKQKIRNQYVLDYLVWDDINYYIYGEDLAEGFLKDFEDPIPW